MTRSRLNGVRGTGFGVYLHWPYCARICPYCDFNVRKRRPVDEAAWTQAFLDQAARAARDFDAPALSSVSFGGGTPSLMAPATVGRILVGLDRRFGLERGAEITLEANPTDGEAARFRDFRAAGVTRLSLGLQSLDDDDLRFLGRDHDADAALRAHETARAAFDHLSLDLIYALPKRSLAHWRAMLERVLDLAADHLSLYQLTLEPGTAFAKRAGRGERMAPPDDRAADLYLLTQDMTERAGLPAYEVSNHAKPCAECRHNRLYWTGGDWLGLGPGAHGRLSTGEGRRAQEGLRDPGRWLGDVRAGGDGFAENRILSAAEAAHEALAMGLRVKEGVEIDDPVFAPVNFDAGRINWAKTEGLIEDMDGRLAATARGRLVLDALMAEVCGA